MIGCSIAYHLSKEGLKVVVFERDSIGCHASGCASGGLVPFLKSATLVDEDLFNFSIRGFNLHEELYQELKGLAGIDYYFRKTNLLRLAFTDEEVNELKKWIYQQVRVGWKGGWLNRREALNIESRIAPAILGAAYIQNIGELDSYKYVLALAQAAEKSGTEIRHGDILNAKKEGANLIRIQLASGDVTCERLILAMGPWAVQAASWFDCAVPVKSQKGQILRLKSPGLPFSTSLSWGMFHMRTKHDGLITGGTTYEDAGFNTQPTVEGRETIINGLLAMIPSLMDAGLALHTACLRPTSEDGLPVIGEIPGLKGVYIATGHGGDGILLSTITANVITDLVLNRKASFPVKPFSPLRFKNSNNALNC